MFFIAPLLVAAIPGVIGLLLTWLFRTRKSNVYVRILPSLLMLAGAGGFIYYGINVVRGFEGASWSLVGIFLFFFSLAGFFMLEFPQKQNINSYSMSSVIIFIFSFLVYSVWFSLENLFNDSLALIVGVGFPIVGLLIAFKGKGKMKTVGIIGNVFVLAFTVIIPAVSTLFWNQP